MAVTTAAEAKKFVLKAYKTEANARADENALLMTSPADEEGSILNNPSQASGYGFWAFQRYWYRIEANEAVSEFHIDWDDGEDNSNKKANVSIIKNIKPTFFGIVSHIYTQAKQFYPLIRVKSQEGFLSKWYTAHAGTGSSALNTFSGLDDAIKTTADEGQVYDSGQNAFSMVSVEQNNDSTAYARIPVFEPANVPPIGVLKVDRKSVFSNIDNTWLGEDGRILNAISAYGNMPYSSSVFAYCSNGSRTEASVKVTYKEGILGGSVGSWGIQTIARGEGQSGTNLGPTDFENKFVIFYSMDNTYFLYVNFDDNQPLSEVVGDVPPGARAVEVTIAENSLSSGVTTISAATQAIKNKIITLTFPEYNGRKEFSGALSTTAITDDTITITNLIPGDTATTVLNQSTGGGADPDWVLFLESYGTNGILGGGVDAASGGLDPSGGNIKQATLTTTVAGGIGSKISNVNEILKVELVDNIESTDSYAGTESSGRLAPGERIYLQAALGTAAAATLPNLGARQAMVNLHGTICSVSTGSPIVELNSVSGHALVDATESKVRSSNNSISSYYFDDNKLVSGDTTDVDGGSNDDTSAQNHQLAGYTTDASANITDILVDGIEGKSSIGTKELRYSHEWWREWQDSNYRYYPQKRLIRCQIKDGHTQVADDSFSRSPIVHWNPTKYLKKGASADLANGQPTEISKHNYGALLFTNNAQNRAPNWVNLEEMNRADLYPILSGDSDGTEGAQLLNSDTVDTFINNQDTVALATHYAPENKGLVSHDDDTESGESYAEGTKVGPLNALFMAQKEKYDRIFVRVSHDRLMPALSGANLNDIIPEPTPGTSDGCPKVRLQILYAAKQTSVASASEDKVTWKPLNFIDRTKLKGKDDSSFYKSGEIIFNPPPDWVKTSHTTMNPTVADDTNIIYPFEDNFYEDGDGDLITAGSFVVGEVYTIITAGNTDFTLVGAANSSLGTKFTATAAGTGTGTASYSTGLDDVWNQDSYALIFLITYIESSSDNGDADPVFNIMHMYPYNNSHSQLLEIKDPTHVSLNSYGIASSVSFVRKGTYQEIKDRSGISQMRRIGATGGTIKLGGIDLKGDVKTTRAKFVEFQKDAVPVYYDVVHKDDSITRLFGVMTSMSEDNPTGSVIPKFSCSMTVTHILEIDSSGNITGDGYIPLGGDTIDVGQYLSAS